MKWLRSKKPGKNHMMLRKSFRTGEKSRNMPEGNLMELYPHTFRSSFREIQKKPAKERRATMEQTGTFNPKKFYEILAGILSRKYGVKITAQEIKKAA